MLVLKVLSEIPDKPSVGSSAITGITIGQHPLVTTAKQGSPKVSETDRYQAV